MKKSMNGGDTSFENLAASGSRSSLTADVGLQRRCIDIDCVMRYQSRLMIPLTMVEHPDDVQL